MKGRDTDTRVEAWQAIINGINGFKGKKDKYQLVPTALYNKKKFRCTESSRLQEFESELRRKGLAGSHKIETIKHVKFQTGDGSKHSIFKYKFGNWRVLFSFLKDEPESASKVELFYMHSVFPRKDGYEKILKTISKQKNVNIEFVKIHHPENINSSIVKNESWKTNEIHPFIPTDNDEYENLKILLEKTEMAVLPTMDQIEAISRKTRPLFINGQAGTGKTTGIAWIVTLLVPNQLKTVKKRTRILVTAMTQNVVDKLDKNTTMLSSHRSEFLGNQFGLKEGQLDAYYADVQEIKRRTERDPKIALDNEGANLVFLNFTDIMEIILKSSEEKLKSEHQALTLKINNPEENSQAEREPGAKTQNLSEERVAEAALHSRLGSLLEIIFGMNSKEVRTKRVNYSKFLIEFYSKRRFKLQPEFAWYGIRTLIKGFAVKNNHQHLDRISFSTKVPASLQSDFVDKEDELFDCYNQYRAWLNEHNLRDDIDLAIDTSYVLKRYDGLIQSKFQHVFLDEAQDLTHAEYQVLLEILDEDSKQNIVLAGDPLQTINPTGFDWNRIKDLMYSEINIEAQDPQVLSHNFRTSTKIVTISNGILKLRENFLTNEKVSIQVSHEEGPKPVLIYLDEGSRNNIDPSLIDELFTNKSNYKVLSRKSDDEGVEELLKDDLLSNERIKSNHNIMTVTEIKGGEHENIILYRAGEIKPNSLNFLLKSKQELAGLDHENKMGLKFIVNQLYILTTRSTKRMYIIEQDRHKGRIWEQLFSEDLEIADDPGTQLKNLLTIASEDFDLETYAKDQLRYFDETSNRKFLKWIKDAFESAKSSEINKKTARELLNRASALDSELDGNFEQAGDHWMKANLFRLAFGCYVLAKKWAKARETNFKDVKRFDKTLTFLEKKTLSKISDLSLLLEEIKVQKVQCPNWLKISDEVPLKQFLFDAIIRRDVDRKELQISQLLTDLDSNSFLPNLEEVDNLLTSLLDEKRVKPLKNLIKQIKKSRLSHGGIEKHEYKLLQLELNECDPMTETEAKKLAEILQFIDSSGTGRKSKSLHLQHFFINILEQIAIKINEGTEPLDLDTIGSKINSRSRLCALPERSFKNLIEAVSKDSQEMEMLMFYFNLSNFPKHSAAKRLPILSALNMFSKSEVKRKNKNTPNFGTNTLEMFQSKEYLGAVSKKCQEELLKVSAEDLSFDVIAITDYETMDWTPDDWGKAFGMKISKIMLNDLNRKIFRTWIEWFETKLRDRTNDPSVNNIIQIMMEKQELIEYLQEIANKTEDLSFNELITYNKILLNPNSSEAEYKQAAEYFERTGDRNKSLQALRHLPDAIYSELTNSRNLEISEFASLIFETSKIKQPKDICELVTEQILGYDKKFMLHHKAGWNKKVISQVLDMVTPPAKMKQPIFVYWRMHAEESMYAMFAHYSLDADNLNARNWKALFRDAKSVANELESLDEIGTIFSSLERRWTDYDNEEEIKLILKQAAIYSIISVLYLGGKKPQKQQIKAMASILNIEIPDRKISEMIRFLLESYGKIIEVDIANDEIFRQFIEEIQ
jgi:hypothetical protein